MYLNEIECWTPRTPKFISAFSVLVPSYLIIRFFQASSTALSHNLAMDHLKNCSSCSFNIKKYEHEARFHLPHSPVEYGICLDFCETILKKNAWHLKSRLAVFLHITWPTQQWIFGRVETIWGSPGNTPKNLFQRENQTLSDRYQNFLFQNVDCMSDIKLSAFILIISFA